jgi:rfaE bifunctional protein nucleotidyltransferase chain/domain
MVIWTNGCYDVLHRGHVELFKYAASLGTKLIVGIDTDERVAAAKGPSRPFNNLEDRKFLLRSIRYIDEVYEYSSDAELENLLVENGVDTMVIGSDWEGKGVIGEKLVKNIKFFDRIEGYSTTKVLESGIRS